MDGLLQDLRYACRSLRRSPGFALVVILTLGVAVGVNTAVFTVTNAILFKGFRGVERNDRIFYIGTQKNGRGCCVSFPDLQDWRGQTRTFADLAGVADLQIVLGDEKGNAEHYDATQITTNAFRLLHQQPILGRDFVERDGIAGAAPVALLRYAFWQRRYGGDPHIVGATIRINGTPTTVIGVMPPGFDFPQNEDLWLPLVPTTELEKREARRLWFAFGRLRDGATIDTARAELATIGRRLATAYPLTNDGWVPQPRTFAEFFVGRDAPMVYGALWGAVAFVVLIACANLANLILARGFDRARQYAMLIALGASRWQVMRRSIVESGILSLLGGSIGWTLAHICVRVYEATANPPARVWSASLFDYSMDGRVLAYTMLVSVATTILFGVGPAIYVSGVATRVALDEAGRGVAGSARGRRLSATLIAAEIAIAVILLAGASVMVRSFMNMARADLGVRTGGVTAMLVSVPRTRYVDARSQTQFFDRLAARLAASTDIERVSLADELPAANGRGTPFEVDGDVPTDSQRRPTTPVMVVGPAYFDTLSAQLLAGRDFNRFDDASAPAVAIVNRKFAEAHWGSADAIGRRVRLFDDGAAGPWLTVVGIAPNIVQNVSDRQTQDALIYRPYTQRPTSSLWVIAKSHGGALAGVFRREIDAIDPDVPIWIGPFALDMLIATMGNYWRLGNNAVLLASFAVIALSLASIGVYAVMAYSVTRRTREIGIRLAVGATARHVLQLVVGQGMQPIGAGLFAGLVLSLGVTPVLASQLVRVSPVDPFSLTIVSGVLMGCGLMACLLPAWRAARVGPAIVLRHD